MKNVIYVSPVKKGAVEYLLERKKKKQHNPLLLEAYRQLWETIGLEHFESWIQTLRGQLYYLHRLQGGDHMLEGLFEEIQKGQQAALDLCEKYKVMLGKDYAQKKSYPKLSEIFSMEFHPQDQGTRWSRVYFLPLLCNKVEDHLQYCKEMQHEKETITKSCEAYGLTKMDKWLQIPENFVIYYQEFSWPHDKVDALQVPQVTQTIHQRLQEHTGLNSNELKPCLKSMIS